MHLTDRFERALLYATAIHAHQRRKGTDIPYLSHLLAVTALVLEHGGDEDEAIGALLHDAAEDAGGKPRLEDIRGRFGERVAAIVEGCTDAWKDPKPKWLKRKMTYLEHLPAASCSVRLVSAADKVHNMGTILAGYQREGEAQFGRFKLKLPGTMWYYRQLADTFTQVGPSSLAGELQRQVSVLEQALGGRWVLNDAEAQRVLTSDDKCEGDPDRLFSRVPLPTGAQGEGM